MVRGVLGEQSIRLPWCRKTLIPGTATRLISVVFPAWTHEVTLAGKQEPVRAAWGSPTTHTPWGYTPILQKPKTTRSLGVVFATVRPKHWRLLA